MRWKLFVHPLVHSLCVAAALVASTCVAVIYIHQLHSQTAQLVTDSVVKLRTAEDWPSLCATFAAIYTSTSSAAIPASRNNCLSWGAT